MVRLYAQRYIMKINEHFISFPPHLSVSWKEIAVLFTKDEDLFLKLHSGDILVIPQLSKEQIETIFACHAKFLEIEHGKIALLNKLAAPFPLPFPFPFDPMEFTEHPIAFKIGTPEGVISALSHNPAQAKSPDLPTDVLTKVSGLSKLIGPQGMQQLPRGEPNCNCFFCQIMNRLHKEAPVPEETVTEDDLKFSEWSIQQTGEKLFSVQNPLDTNEKYSVYLGHPVGCSCGKSGCEHIIAVLKS